MLSMKSVRLQSCMNIPWDRYIYSTNSDAIVTVLIALSHESVNCTHASQIASLVWIEVAVNLLITLVHMLFCPSFSNGFANIDTITTVTPIGECNLVISSQMTEN